MWRVGMMTLLTGLVLAAGGPTSLLQRQGRIVQGRRVTEGARWVVSLQANAKPYCGGTLIRPGWVLTAAHCVSDLVNSHLAAITAHVDGTVSHDMRLKYKVLKVIAHDDYDDFKKLHDIGLVKLDMSENQTMEGPFLQLNSEELPAGTVCNVTGFGKTSAMGVPSRELLWAQVPINTVEDCKAFTEDHHVKYADGMVCAGGGKTDACQGDSGGPLVYCPNGSLSDAECRLVGIVSWGIGCAIEGYLGVYTRVSRYIDWVDSTIAKNS